MRYRQILLLIIHLMIVLISLSACDDNDLSRRGSAVFVTDQEEYTFPAPNFESQSSELSVTLENQGGGSLVIIGVKLEERDEVKELSILDESDWTSGQVIIGAGSEKRIGFLWSVLDAQADEASVTFTTNIGEHTIRLTTPDIDPELYVSSDTMIEGDTRGGRIALGNVPAGGLGRVRLTLQSVGAINLNINQLCFLGSDQQCEMNEDENMIKRSGSFILCDGLPNQPSDCEPVNVEQLLPGATKTLSIFYAPDSNELDSEVARLSILSDSGMNPSYLLSLQGEPCVRSEEQPECGGCGDGIVNGAETCDDGNLVMEDGCLNSCVLATCGDGHINEGVEACDDGNLDQLDSCTNSCELPRCGDGLIQANESCDDAGESASCDSDCTLAECGDEVLNLSSGESCDEGGDTVLCNFDCSFTECGDGYINLSAGESCDDGDDRDSDGCSATCTIEAGYVCEGTPSTCTTVCGDSITAGDELCDDGNTVTEACDYNQTECTVCAADCTHIPGAVRYCGDGVLDTEDAEACDDGNREDNDGCSATCTIEAGYACEGTPSTCTTVCGDGITAGDELCDDGNTITDNCEYDLQSCEVCRADCTLGDGVITYCGDGALNGPEACDLGEDNGIDNCQYGENPCQICGVTCALEAGNPQFCGDGIVQAEFEDCDGTRGCSELCRLPCSPNCPPIEMVEIQPGTFTMGSEEFWETIPSHSVTINYPFQISKTEVTVSDYTLCVNDGYCSAAGTGGECNTGISGKEDHPQNCITRSQLRTFAVWVGADIPTEAEWEYAARLTSGRTFPWGETTSTACASSRANVSPCIGGTKAVCQMANGYTPEGLCDMSGNVREWVIDLYQANHNGAPIDGSAQCGGGDCESASSWVTKSGGYTGLIDTARLYFREEASSASPTIGGRIVRF